MTNQIEYDPNDWMRGSATDVVYADDEADWFSKSEKIVVAGTCSATGDEDFEELDTYSYLREGTDRGDLMHYPASRFVGTEVTELFDSYERPTGECVCECEKIEDDTASYNCMLQTQGLARPKVLFSSHGPHHCPTFVGECVFKNKKFVTKSCGTKKEVDRHVAHIIMHHLPSQDHDSNVYRFCEVFFSEMVQLRGEDVQWYRSADHIVMVVGLGSSTLSFMYADTDMARGRYECMHSYNKFYQSYFVLPHKFRTLTAFDSIVVREANTLTVEGNGFTQEVLPADPQMIKVLKMVRVVCGNEALRRTLRKVYLSPVHDRDYRTFGDIEIDGINIRVLMENPTLAYMVERLSQMTVRDVKSELEFIQGRAATDKLFSLHKILPGSKVSRVRVSDEKHSAGSTSPGLQVINDYRAGSERKVLKREVGVPMNDEFRGLLHPMSVIHVPPEKTEVSKNPVRISVQGKEIWLTVSPEGGDVKTLVFDLVREKINKIYQKTPLHNDVWIAHTIVSYLSQAEYEPTSQEVHHYVKCTYRILKPGGILEKKAVHRVLEHLHNYILVYDMRGRDKHWRLRLRNGRYDELQKFWG